VRRHPDPVAPGSGSAALTVALCDRALGAAPGVRPRTDDGCAPRVPTVRDRPGVAAPPAFEDSS
jgi:hypothetical protein